MSAQYPFTPIVPNLGMRPKLYDNNSILNFRANAESNSLQPLPLQNSGIEAFTAPMNIPNAVSPYSFDNGEMFPGGDADSLAGAATEFAAGVPQNTSVWQKLFGYNNKATGESYGGAFAPIATGAAALGNIHVGLKQIKNADRALDMQEDQFDRNFDMQTEMVNRRLEARENARLRLSGMDEATAAAQAREYVAQSGAGKY
jgi:hypothetical protein